jgi:hypothetical protein
MDKYQRKQLRKRDERHGQRQDEIDNWFKNGYKTKKQIKDINQIQKELRDYKPTPVITVQEIMDIYKFEQSYGIIYNYSYMEYMYATLKSSRVLLLRPFLTIQIGDYEFCESQVVEHGLFSFDVERSIQKGKKLADEKYTHQYLKDFNKTLRKTKDIRDELIQAYPRWRAVLNCKVIKEELMMSVWHPRRIARILELGGHAALDNFAGL